MNQILALQKFRKQMEEIEKLRFIAEQDLFPLRAAEDTVGRDEIHTQVQTSGYDICLEQGSDFIGRDKYLWLEKKVKIPKEKEGYLPFGYFDFGKTGEGHNSGFESLLYVDEEPYQGVDSNHKEVCFSELAGKTVQLHFMLWSGLEGGGSPKLQEHRLKAANLGYLHCDSDEFYYYAKAISETLEYLPQESPDREPLIGAMEAAFLEIDWDIRHFYRTVSAALGVLKTRLESLEKDRKITVHCVGHTHIDVAWLWRLKHTQEKSIRSFATVMKLMEEFEDYRFIQSQPQLYQYIKKNQPQLFEKIKQRVREKKWEADGGMWLEADCNISSGESLSRQFLYGTSFFEKELGVQSQYLWLPDVFGYSWALPQILKECDIKTFMTTKISWNQYNTIPNDLFMWQGIDGSKVLTYFIDTPSHDRDLEDRYATYNGFLNPRSVMGSWKRFKNKELSNEVLVSYGYGDGGGGPNREMLKLRRTMDQLPGLPKVKNSTPSEFFDRIHEKVKKTDRPVPVWNGELYLEYHRGTYTTQAAIKKWNRVLENRLAQAEYLSALAAVMGGTYEKGKLDFGWEVVLRNQFHDIIPGSSIREVNEEAVKEYESANEAVREVVELAGRKLIKPAENKYTLFQFNGLDSKPLALIPEHRTGHFQMEGVLLQSQKTKEGYYVRTGLPGFQLATVDFFESVPPAQANAFTFENNVLTTPNYTIRWNRQGYIDELYDIRYQRHVIRPGGLGNLLEVYEDKPLANENWDIEVYHTQKKELFKLTKAPFLVENGPLVAVIRTEYEYRDSKISQDMVVYADSCRIDFKTLADWQESYRLLKTAFDLNLHATTAHFDIQYGHVQRPTHSNTSWDIARFEVVGHKWADVSETNYGVSLLNDCKYGYSAKDNTLRLTLLKSTKYPDTHADMGTHTFTYALLPHEGRVEQGGTIQEAVELNTPVKVFAGERVSGQRLVYTEQEAVMFDAVKRSEDGTGYVVRLHECRGGSHKIRLKTDLKNVTIQSCNILEKNKDEQYQPDQWIFEITPFEIKTFKILT